MFLCDYICYKCSVLFDFVKFTFVVYGNKQVTVTVRCYYDTNIRYLKVCSL